MVTGGHRASAALLSMAGLAIIGYAGVRWTMGDQPIALPTWDMGTAVSGLAEYAHAGPVPLGSQVRPLIPAANAPQPGGHPQLGIVSALELTGVLISGQVSMAIIADAGGPDKVYRIGEQIREGVTVAAVFRNGVVVAHGDLRQRLPLIGRTRPENPPPAISQANSPRTELPASERPGADGGTTGKWRPRNLSPEVLRQGLIVPDPEGGFQLRKIMPNSLYAKAGLRTGDVLRGANGQPMDSPEQLMLLYRKLSEGGQGNVELVREGRPETLQFGWN